MPLIKSGSKAAFKSNVAEMIRAGHPRDQALAASYSNARRYGRKYADGGRAITEAPAWIDRDDAPLERYPDSRDVAFARQYGHFDTDPRSEYLNNERYRLLKGDPNPWMAGKGELGATEYSGEGLRNLNERAPQTKRLMRDYYARGSLASKRSALAALGFDPAEVAADVTRPIHTVNIAGSHSNLDNKIYANADSPTTLMHESIHRGINRLKDTPYWRPEFDRFNSREWSGHHNNEMATRYLMARRMGDAELNRQQRDEAVYKFEKVLGSERDLKLLKEMEMAASRYLASRNPRGPRARGGRTYAEGGDVDEPTRQRGLQQLRREMKPPPIMMYNPATRSTYPIPRPTNEGAQRREMRSIDDAVPRRASGGNAVMPWTERAAARSLGHAGMIRSPVPGRTDRLPIGVGGGAYVLPADHVAHIGENNSTAGAAILDSMFKMGKFGAARSTKPRMPRFGLRRRMFAEGGSPDKNVDIIAAGGEYVIPPEIVQEIGGGDMDAGHKILDRWVLDTRKDHIRTLRGLKPPKKS